MRKFIFITAAVLIGCLLAAVVFIPGMRDKNRHTYNGKPIEYWEKQALIHVPQGSFETIILPAVEKMGPEVLPFWLERLQTRDSRPLRLYSQLCSSLPARLRALLPGSIPPRTRRNVAYLVLSKLHFTNGTPELIELTYSKDAELQFYAVNLLWVRAYRGLEPSRECIAAFCSALKAGDARTRLWAVHGLNTIPVWREALPALHLALKDPEEEIRVTAAVAILKLQPDCDFTHIFRTGLASSNSNVGVISRVELSKLQRRQMGSPLESGAKP